MSSVDLRIEEPAASVQQISALCSNKTHKQKYSISHQFLSKTIAENILS